ncbi:hypothetical protein EVAR_60228_1 [Eumeta japonica]|uniref:Uncharacterized protein n=1 Tax=Eumeta variegata TaxID=151549 RepID=A0A4C1Z2X5_EUMVA|nr:hypothetical protein EVAR_60228_1 [Eumeta japonica]
MRKPRAVIKKEIVYFVIEKFAKNSFPRRIYNSPSFTGTRRGPADGGPLRLLEAFSGDDSTRRGLRLSSAFVPAPIGRCVRINRAFAGIAGPSVSSNKLLRSRKVIQRRMALIKASLRRIAVHDESV